MFCGYLKRATTPNRGAELKLERVRSLWCARAWTELAPKGTFLSQTTLKKSNITSLSKASDIDTIYFRGVWSMIRWSYQLQPSSSQHKLWLWRHTCSYYSWFFFIKDIVLALMNIQLLLVNQCKQRTQEIINIVLLINWKLKKFITVKLNLEISIISNSYWWNYVTSTSHPSELSRHFAWHNSGAY